MPKRIQLRRTKGWRKPEGAVNVARPTKWGNPWRIEKSPVTWLDKANEWRVVGEDGCRFLGFSSSGDANAYAISRYRMAIDHCRDYGRNWLGFHYAEISDLRGKDLCCWCPLDQACHADVLLELANA